MAKSGSDIPVGTQFNPDLIHLPSLAKAIVAHSGDKDALKHAVWNAPVQLKNPGKKPTKRNESLPLEAAAQYGLLTPKTWNATPLAEQLAKLDVEEDVFVAFAKHILLSPSCNGLRFVEGAQRMAADRALHGGGNITGPSLARHLTKREGLRVTEQNGQINSMRLWLERVGIFGNAAGTLWTVNPERKKAILGLGDDEIASVASLGPMQQAIALALCREAPQSWVLGSAIRHAAGLIYGDDLPASSLPNLVEPLRDAGYVEVDAGGGTAGGKSAKLRTTPKFNAEVLEPFLQSVAKQLDAGLLKLYRMSPEQIKEDLQPDNSKNVKGVALEAFAVRVMRVLGLRFVGWRARGAATGGAEVDAVMVGTFAGIPTRWQIQCKNTPDSNVGLDEVAKEVGLTALTKATHIMMFSTGGYSKDARRYADAAMQATPLAIYLFGKVEFDQVLKAGGDLPQLIRKQSEYIADLPRQGVDWLKGAAKN